MQQNLFDKYGIKEVADVTFYRIEKKEETYEAHREITVASILKGAIELQDVYPLNEQGVGSEDGFKAYVFKDADIIHGINYDCDDIKQVREVYTVIFKTKKSDTIKEGDANGHPKLEEFYQKFLKNEPISFVDSEEDTVIDFKKEQYDPETGYELVPSDLKGFSYYDGLVDKEIPYKNTTTTPLIRKIEDFHNDSESFVAKYSATYTILTVYKNDKELITGIYKKEKNNGNNKVPDNKLELGTHEYTYEEQVCMLFATRQNLITKTGVRYEFTHASDMFGNIEFNDNFSNAPMSSEKVVVVGIAGQLTEATYDIPSVNEYIKSLTTVYRAKGYDVTYSDYAELVVNDEMGYYNPSFLGYGYKRDNAGNGVISFFDRKKADKKNGSTYIDWAKQEDKKGFDAPLAMATMWNDGVHFSINDAIDALRQKKKILDTNTQSGLKGIKSIFGGYRVSEYPGDGTDEDEKVSPKPGLEDLPGQLEDDYDNNIYQYKADGENITGPFSSAEDGTIESTYPLEEVEAAVQEIGYTDSAIGKDIRVDVKDSGLPSNRAIYVRVDGMVDTSAGAFIYLLHNKNYRKLALDKDGIFEFEDKKGNTLYYQDKIFKKIEWLALVIIGDKGLIFVVNRHGRVENQRIGWMINQSGYVTDTQAARLSHNGLIHTTDITVNNETFQATCTVKSLKTHKTKKRTDHYIPVLFLDTLKISTIEQTAEEVYATGGRGNANLIGWDFNKEITLSLEDALFTPASMSAIFGSYEGNDFRKGVKEVKSLDRFEKVVAKRSFIVPPGNMNGTPTEANKTAQAVFYDPNTMEPYPDGTPIAEGELFYKFTRSIAYEGQSLGHMIEISADKFPGTYRVVGDTYVRSKETGEDERFQFIICQAKMTSEQTITLEADGDPAVNIIQSNAAVKIA